MTNLELTANQKTIVACMDINISNSKGKLREFYVRQRESFLSSCQAKVNKRKLSPNNPGTRFAEKLCSYDSE